jgi:hypothetical protein
VPSDGDGDSRGVTWKSSTVRTSNISEFSGHMAKKHVTAELGKVQSSTSTTTTKVDVSHFSPRSHDVSI